MMRPLDESPARHVYSRISSPHPRIMSDHRSSHSPRVWLLILAVWIIWALLSSVELVARMLWLQQPLDFGQALMVKLPVALALAALTPGVLAVSRRFPLLDAQRNRRWDVHIVAWLALVVIIDAVSCAQAAWSESLPFDLGSGRSYLIRVLGLWLLPIGLLYWLIVVIDHGIRHFLAARDQREAAARLEAQVARSRLEALKLQLHPHFLFNALHSIAALVRTGRSSDAIRVAAGLGDLLRRLLDEAPVQEVSLREEMAFLRDYLDIELIRFRDRLRVTYDIAPEAESALVPHLLLQPLVENALRHGLQSRADGGCLTIRARRANGALELTVADDGAGPRPDARAERQHGVGLANARARLRELYGERQSLELCDLDGAGTEVRVRLPFHPVGSVPATSP